MFTAGDNNFANKNSECDVLTFIPEERIDIIHKLKTINFGSDELAKNYENIDWFDLECITVLLKNDDVLGFSSAWHRKEFYKPGEVRILNRYWEHNKLRMPGRLIARPHLVATVQHQLHYVKEAGYKEAFISRERNPGYMKRLVKEIGKKTNTAWNFHDEKVCVCDKKDAGCWQYKGTYEIKN